jgi:hypothetical protein
VYKSVGRQLGPRKWTTHYWSDNVKLVRQRFWMANYPWAVAGDKIRACGVLDALPGISAFDDISSSAFESSSLSGLHRQVKQRRRFF